MYISTKEHILSGALFLAAVLKLLQMVGDSLIRIIFTDRITLKPDMLNTTVTNFQLGLSALQITLTIIVLYNAFKRLKRYRGVVEKNDYLGMAKIHEEIMDEGVSNLTSYTIMQLLQMWSAILVASQIVYEIISFAYQSFVSQLVAAVDMADEDMVSAFVSMYNNSHGFKYIGMFIALNLGFFVTGIILKDKLLKIISIILIVFFMGAFVILQMNTVTLLNRTVGIVWTSVIYHIMQTVGLLAFSIYLRIKYKGL